MEAIDHFNKLHKMICSRILMNWYGVGKKMKHTNPVPILKYTDSVHNLLALPVLKVRIILRNLDCWKCHYCYSSFSDSITPIRLNT